jgi:hypothetical protein
MQQRRFALLRARGIAASGSCLLTLAAVLGFLLTGKQVGRSP